MIEFTDGQRKSLEGDGGEIVVHINFLASCFHYFRAFLLSPLSQPCVLIFYSIIYVVELRSNGLIVTLLLDLFMDL